MRLMGSDFRMSFNITFRAIVSAETGGICTESDNNWQVCCTVAINSHWMKRFTGRLIS